MVLYMFNLNSIVLLILHSFLIECYFIPLKVRICIINSLREVTVNPIKLVLASVFVFAIATLWIE